MIYFCNLFDDMQKVFNTGFLIWVLLPLGLIAQKRSAHIECEVVGQSAGVARMFGCYGDENYYLDSAIIDAQGKFIFHRDTGYQPGYYYAVLPGNANFQFLLDDQQKFKLKTNKVDLFKYMHVEGSADNKMLYESFELQSQVEKKVDSLRAIKNPNPADAEFSKNIEKQITEVQALRKTQLKEFQTKYPNSFFVKFKLAGQNPDIVDVRKPNGDLDTSRQLRMFRSAFWDGVDFSDERLLHTPVIGNKLRKHILDFTVQQQDSLIEQVDFILKKSLANKEIFKFISNWIVIKYQPTKTTVMGGENVFVHIIQKWFTKEYATWLSNAEYDAMQKKATEMESSLLGKIGPNVISTDPKGNKKSIYESKKDYVIVFMFNPDCEHCQKETPELLEVYKRIKDKVDVYAIALTTTEKEWLEFIQKYGTQEWTNVYDPTNASIYAKYYVDITPEIYVLNKDHKIIGKNLHPNQVEMILERDKQ